MKKNKSLYFLFFCLCFACFSSCSQEEISEQPAGDKAAVEEIKNLIDLGSLSLPDVSQNGDKATRGSQTLYYTPSAVTPIWDSYQRITKGDNEIWMFQLKASKALTGMVQSYYYEKEENLTTPAIFKLAVRQVNGQTISRIITYIPNENYLQKAGIQAEALGYDLKGINYSGKVIISSLDGKIIFGEEYEDGEVTYRFCPEGNVLYNIENRAKLQTEKSNNFRLSFNLFAEGRTRAFNNGAICTVCGNPIDKCGCRQDHFEGVC